MNKVYYYQMKCCTEETYLHVGTEPLSMDEGWDIMYDHATGYQEQDEDGEWEPEMWLEAVITTVKQLEAHSGDILRGYETLGDLIVDLAEEGMVW